MGKGLADMHGRQLRDLRLSVTDRCNFRCRYCMPAEVFGLNYQFLETSHLLSFTEMGTLVRGAVELGVKKVRLTGGEPLLRKGIDNLVSQLSAIDGIEEIALTTNGVLLAHYAERLVNAGLSRITVSLDAIEPMVFSEMNGVGAKIERVLKGIEMAQHYGLSVKVNMVVQKGVNEGQIIPLLEYCLNQQIQLRLIEFMDVGESNQWQKEDVLSTEEVIKIITGKYSLIADKRPHGAVAETHEVYDGTTLLGKVGFISSVTRPFCSDCGRLRVSAEGKVYGCLFASEGYSVKEVLRRGASLEEIMKALSNAWSIREDRYSELRGQTKQNKVEMSYIGG